MILCNGCSKTGTHILTIYAKAIGLSQVGGTLIKRHPKATLKTTSIKLIKDIMAHDNGHFMHCHVSYTNNLRQRLIVGEHKMIHIIRHPRNVAVSWMRHRNKQNPDIEVSTDSLKELIQGKMFNMSVPDHYKGFLKWVHTPEVLTVRFEDVFENSDKVFSQMSAFIGIDGCPKPEDVFGHGVTNNDKKSTWQEWWDEDVDFVWREAGGIELEGALGY